MSCSKTMIFPATYPAGNDELQKEISFLSSARTERSRWVFGRLAIRRQSRLAIRRQSDHNSRNTPSILIRVGSFTNIGLQLVLIRRDRTGPRWHSWSTKRPSKNKVYGFIAPALE